MKKSIAVATLAILAISLAFLPLATADTTIKSTWIRMRGIIHRWGDDPVFGWVGAHARIINDNGTIHKWAGAHATWSYEKPRLNCTQPPRENVTFTVFHAILVNQSDVKLNFSGAIVHISGLWDVFNVTTTIVVNENGTLISFTRTWVPWITEAPGFLRVLAPPEPHMPLVFNLGIDGMPPLHGFVVKLDIRYVVIKICDLNDDGYVDILDLVRVARRYRAMPGFPTYDPEMDFNFDCIIDIGDLATAAANIEG